MSLKRLIAIALVTVAACGQSPLDEAHGFSQPSAGGLAKCFTDGANFSGNCKSSAPLRLLGGTGNTGTLTTNSNGAKITTFSGTLGFGELTAYVGNPNTNVSADAGSICLDTSTPALWLNTNGATAWTKLQGSGDVSTTVNTALQGGNAGGLFGDGSDGALTYDGTTAVLGITPAANVYILGRDIFATNITINTGVTVQPNGFGIWASGTVTLSGTGKIDAAGANGGAITGGAGWPRVSNTRFNVAAGATGGNGTATAGNAGGSVSNGPRGHGGCGAGGAGLSGAGGAAGTVTALSATDSDFHDWQQVWTGRSAKATTLTVACAGGGGGGTNVANASGAGGGGGGGPILIRASKFAGSGSITAKGGDGGTPSGAGAANCTAGGNGCGGGGGGGGGLIIEIHQSGSAPTESVAGGGAGSKLGTAGVNGNAGGAGILISINVSGT